MGTKSSSKKGTKRNTDIYRTDNDLDTNTNSMEIIDEDRDDDDDDDNNYNYNSSNNSSNTVHRGWCLSFFLLINICSILFAFGVIIAQMGTIIYDGRSLFSMPQTVALRTYGVVFACIIILTELRWTRMINESTFLQNWVTRGLFYIFVGLLTLEQNQEKAIVILPPWILFYIKIVGLILITIGILYMIMGLMCLRRLKDRKEAEYRAKQYHFYTQAQYTNY